MPPQYQHPGLYIQELAGTRSIAGVPTSVAAFVGVTQSGPVGAPTLVTSWSHYQRQFGGLVWQGQVSWAVYEFFVEGGTTCYVVRAQARPEAAPAQAASGTLTVTASTPGSWGNQLQFAIANADAAPGSPLPTPVFNFLVLVAAAVIDGPPASAGAADPAAAMLRAYVRHNRLARIDLQGGSCYVLESFGGLTAPDMAPGGPFVQRVNTTSMFVQVASSAATRPPNGVTPLGQGRLADHDLLSAVRTLDGIPGLSLLAVPDTVGATGADSPPGPLQQAALVRQGLAFCEGLRSLFYVCDPPFGLDLQAALDFKCGTGPAPDPSALRSSFGALYYPWVWCIDPMSGTAVPIPPSGPVIGRYVHTDLNVGVWKSPAGVSDGAMHSIAAVATLLTDSDQERLNPADINAIRNLPGHGIVVYGARTLAGDRDWTYVAVRRLAIYVEQSLMQGLQWVVFEPNGRSLWSAVGREISGFLTTLWQRGALFGATAQQAFFVTCDASNNTPATCAAGQLHIDIGLAAVFPAEFTILRLTLQAAVPAAGP